MNSKVSNSSIKPSYKDSRQWQSLQSSLCLINRSSTEALKDSEYLTPILAKIAHSASASVIKLHRNHPLASMQNPQELAHALIRLSQEPIAHFCELGSLLGGTSMIIAAYLKKFNPSLKMSVIHSNVDPECYQLLQEIVEVNLLDEGDISKESFDLCLVGPTENFAEIESLYKNTQNHSKIFMFHHIYHGYHLENFVLTPLLSSEGIVKFWEVLKEKMKNSSHFFEYSFSYGQEASQGIGLQILD